MFQREPINDFHGYNTYQTTRGQHIANGKASTNEVNDGRYEGGFLFHLYLMII